MTNELKTDLEMFDMWTETTDKKEYIQLGMRLFPETTEEHLLQLFDKSLAGTSSTKEILAAMMNLYERITDDKLFVRRVIVTANHVIDERRMDKTALQLAKIHEDKTDA